MGDRVVLRPDARYAEQRRQAGHFHQWREAGIKREDGTAIEREPLVVAPQRWRARGNFLARRQATSGIVEGLERSKALFTDRDRCCIALDAAIAAPEWKRTDLRRNGSCGHAGHPCRLPTGDEKKRPRQRGADVSLFSICLTWLQYAANDHGSIVCIQRYVRPVPVSSSTQIGSSRPATRCRRRSAVQRRASVDRKGRSVSSRGVRG